MRQDCRACRGRALEIVFDFGLMPLAGAFLSDRSAIASEQQFPLTVHVCRDCALVQILDPIDPDVLFRDYAFSSSTVGPLVQHFDAYAQWLVDRYAPARVIEFGCNDGILLAPLKARGVTTVGVDISENITAMARGKGLDVVTGYFNDATARAIASRIGQRTSSPAAMRSPTTIGRTSSWRPPRRRWRRMAGYASRSCTRAICSSNCSGTPFIMNT